MKINVTNNEKSIILKNLAIEINHYVVIFEITQLIDNKERIQEVHKITIYFINNISKRIYAFFVVSILFNLFFDNNIKQTSKFDI